MKKLKFTQSFTLIELALVMAIIMAIAGLLMGAGRRARIAAMEARAKSMIASLEVAISMYHADTGEYPDEDLDDMISALKADPGDVSNWRGPYMEFKREDYQDDDPDTNVIVDPWGKAYHYIIMKDKTPGDDIMWGNTNSYNLWSNGPTETDESGNVDGDTDFGDDIHNW